MTENEKKYVDSFEARWGKNGVLRANWILFLRDCPSNTHITLTTNKTRAHLGYMSGLLKTWLGMVERGWLGGRYYEKPSEERITGFFFCESLSHNPHIHGILRVPPNRLATNDNKELVRTYLNDKWQRLLKTGDAETEFTTNTDGASIYQTKQYRNAEQWQDVILAEDFWPA